MYLLLNDKEKIIVDTVKEIEKYNINDYKVYSLGFVDSSELLTEKEVRDTICKILKGNEMTKDELIEKVVDYLEVKKSNVSKVITKMKKEKIIFDIDDFNQFGERIISME